MTTLSTYQLFDGTCERAMLFYQTVFGGELAMTQVGLSPMKDLFPPSMHHKIIHANLKSPAVNISASDWLRPDQLPISGNTICLYLSGGTPEELKTPFDRLSEEATITDPLTEQPFGMYGALNDQFGFRWMFQTEIG